MGTRLSPAAPDVDLLTLLAKMARELLPKLPAHRLDDRRRGDRKTLWLRTENDNGSGDEFEGDKLESRGSRAITSG